MEQTITPKSTGIGRMSARPARENRDSKIAAPTEATSPSVERGEDKVKFSIAKIRADINAIRAEESANKRDGKSRLSGRVSSVLDEMSNFMEHLQHVIYGRNFHLA